MDAGARATHGAVAESVAKPIIKSLFPPQIIFQFHHDTPYYREQAVFFWFRYGELGLA